MEPMKAKRSEKGTLGRVWAATRVLLNSVDGYCYRTGLHIVDESLPMRVLRARAESSILVSPGRKDRTRGVAPKGGVSPNPG